MACALCSPPPCEPCLASFVMRFRLHTGKRRPRSSNYPKPNHGASFDGTDPEVLHPELALESPLEGTRQEQGTFRLIVRIGESDQRDELVERHEEFASR